MVEGGGLMVEGGGMMVEGGGLKVEGMFAVAIWGWGFGEEDQQQEAGCKGEVGKIVVGIVLADAERGQGSGVDINQVGLVVNEAIVYQRHDNHTRQCHKGAHQHHAGQSINSDERIADDGRQHDIGHTKPLGSSQSQTAEPSGELAVPPKEGSAGCDTKRGHVEIAWLLDQIDPIAQIDNRCEQTSNRQEHQRNGTAL